MFISIVCVKYYTFYNEAVDSCAVGIQTQFTVIGQCTRLCQEYHRALFSLFPIFPFVLCIHSVPSPLYLTHSSRSLSCLFCVAE